MLLQMMYVLPMMLGRTYDMQTNSIGVDIFPKEALQDLTSNPVSFYESSFRTVEKSSDLKESLGVMGDLSLGIKAGLFNFRGMGSYLKDRMKAQNAIDILTKVYFRTVSKSIPLSAQPVGAWSSTGKQYLGTHFVRSIIYGGNLLACVRFKAIKSEYMQHIKAEIKSSLSKGNAFEITGGGKLETLNKNLTKYATMEIKYFATVPLHGVPNTIKGLKELVRDFKKHVQEENNGLGVPVEVELESLSTFDKRFSFLKNTELETELKLFEEKFDELLTIKSKLKSWISSLPDILSEEHQKLISDFSDRISTILRKFIETIGKLDLGKGSSQLEEAKAAYAEGRKFPLPGKFNQALNQLQRKIVLSKVNPEDKGSSSYIHYGSSKCINEEYTSTVFPGYLASSPRNFTGAGFNYLCFPKVATENTNKEVDGDTSTIAGIKYGLLLDTPHKIEDDTVLKGVVCAVCLVKYRPTTLTFLGQNQCPEDEEWTMQYNGFIMASTDVDKSQNICVDSKHESHEDNDPSYQDQSLNFVVAETDDGINFIPCAVCSK